MISKRKLEVGIEEIILGAIILLNILAVLGLLTTDLDYIKKIISWSAVGYLLYKTRPAKIFTGNVDKTTDTLLLTGYFCLFLKNLVSFSFVGDTSAFLRPLYAAFRLYATQIELVGLYAGIVIFLYVGIRLLLQHTVKEKSLLAILGEHNTSLEHFGWLRRYLKLQVLIIGFFIVIFSLVMEWLAVAIDAPLLMVGLAVYFFFIIKHKETFSEQSFLRKFGDFGGDFYENVIEHLRYKKTTLRVIAGMLVLHLITDTFVFVWSYLSGVSDRLYFGALGRDQFSFVTGIVADSAVWGAFSTIVLTILNVVGILFLLVFPVVLWYELYKNKHTKINHNLLALFVTSLVACVLAPVFKIVTLHNKPVYGIDIIAGPLRPVLNPLAITFGCIALFGILYMISLHHRKTLSAGLLLTSLGFVTWYVVSFYNSLMQYYLLVVPITISVGQWIIGGFLAILWILTTLFYLTATVYFIIDVIKHIKEHVTVT